MADYKGKYTGERIDELLTKVEEGDIANHCIPTTYAELKALCDAGELTIGAWYRITDYVAETKQINTRSAGHAFDILVFALDERTLSEECKAIVHEGDTYFRNSNLSAWKVWYTTDNNRRSWGVPSSQKRPEQWSCAWGVLDSNTTAQGSKGYTTTEIDGKTMYLYRPAEPTDYLHDKNFYHETVYSRVTSPDELVYESDSAPSYYYDEEMGEEVYDFPNEIRVKSPNGNLITKFTLRHDNYYRDMNDNDEDGYEVSFSDYYEKDDDVFHLYPESEEDLYEWWEYVIGGVLEDIEREPFLGSYDSLRYAFDKVLPQSESQPKPIVYSIDTGLTYKADNWDDSISFTRAIDGGKGVIYRLIDEFGNDLPFDFKNIQHELDGKLYYTFGISDTSLAGGSTYNNCIHIEEFEIPRYIFTSGNVYENRIESSNPKEEFDYVITPYFCVFTGTFYRNHINLKGVKEIRCSSNFIGNSVSGELVALTSTKNIQHCEINTLGKTVIDTVADLYMCRIDVQPRNNMPLVINAGRFQWVNIRGTGYITVADANGNGKYLTMSSINTGMNGSTIYLQDTRTHSLSNRLEGLQVDILNKGNTETRIDTSSIPLNATHKTNIGINSTGEVKIWNDADKA